MAWAASAAVGGALADQFGYRTTFLLTALLQGAGTMLLLSLLLVLPRSEGWPRRRREEMALAKSDLGTSLLNREGSGSGGRT